MAFKRWKIALTSEFPPHTLIIPSVLIFLIVPASLLTACTPKAFCDTVTDVPADECRALEIFYNTTDGPNWTDSRGWVTSTEVCTWFAIGCEEGHVIAITANYNELTGQLPDALVDLSELKHISLYYNHLSGPLPPKIGQLKKLQFLIIHNNDLSGTLPPELGKLSNLLVLDLDSNALSGSIPSEFAGMTSLQELKLRDNNLSGPLPAALGQLIHLEGLWLSNNQFTGNFPNSYANLTNLRMLGIYNNPGLEPIPEYFEGLAVDGYPDWTP